MKFNIITVVCLITCVPTAQGFSAGGFGKDFIDALVNQHGDISPLQKYTHMIAIPMETNHDLMLELESVQRAVLYHCPLLINACIVPALTRMPLLLINTKTSRNTILGQDRWAQEESLSESPLSSDDVLTSQDPSSQALYATIQEVVRDTINVIMDFSLETEEQRGRNGVNDSNIKPMVLSFKGLEVDGEDNSVLYAIGKEDLEAQRLRRVVMEIATRIRRKYGWDVAFPPDLTLEKKQRGEDMASLWRPRVPFMRLPTNFKETLPNPKGMDGEWEVYTPEEKASYIRFPEEGGNGISPIFWYQWWEDSFCNGNSIRMKELAVYGRTGPFDISETAFYIPHLKVNLPDGNKQLQEDEMKARKYALSRQDARDEEINEKRIFTDEADTALSKMKSETNRRIIETIYASSPSDESNLAKPMQGQGAENSLLDNEEQSFDLVKVDSPSTMMSRLETKEKKVPPEDNPIFKGWKDRKTMTVDTPSFQSNKMMPSFPSNEYFVGLWRLISSPIMLDRLTGESAKPNDPSPSENETLILRVDGTTAGGPILDFEQNLKSAGGTWRSFQAVWNGDDVENVSLDDTEQTRLRIRLVVPPKKETILVMEGEIRRTPYSSLLNQNIREIKQLSTFSIPQVESAQGININHPDDSLTIYCSGEMWLEAAFPKTGQRKKLGSFTLVKMVDPNPTQIRYSIPSNKLGYYQ